MDLKNTGNFLTRLSADAPGNGIGGYYLQSRRPGLAFDYDGSGKLDHLALYRPGQAAYDFEEQRGNVLTRLSADASCNASAL